jgi:enoyl-CoA hydratase/carnithine racemase
MTSLDEYATRYPNIAMERRDGILQVTLHSGGDSLQWCNAVHEDLPRAFREIARDVENRIVILTGTGADFCRRLQQGGFTMKRGAPSMQVDRIYQDGKDIILNHLDIKVPMIAVVNGPVQHHMEVPLLCDIVLASDTAIFQDRKFYHGNVPGNGMHLLLPLLMGANRGRYYSLTSKKITALEALEWGLVAEVWPGDKVLARAWELAADLARRPLLGLRYAREVLTLEIKRLFEAHLPHGLALEALAGGYGAWREEWQR